MKKISAILTTIVAGFAMLICGISVHNNLNTNDDYILADASDVLWTDDSVLGSTTFANEADADAGMVSNPFQIATPFQLALVAKRSNSGLTYLAGGDTYYYSDSYYKITANIDLGAYQWVPIGTETQPFTGRFDGSSSNFSISNLTRTYINTTDTNTLFYGLFGYVNCNSAKTKILNISLIKPNINITTNTGQDIYIGAMVGYITYFSNASLGYLYVGQGSNNSGEINVSATSNTSNCYIGGLVGYSNVNIDGISTNYYCYSNVAITYSGEDISTLYIGEVAGYSALEAKYIQAAGSIESSYGTIGGIIGYLVGASASTVSSATLTVGNLSNDVSTSYAGGIVGNFAPLSATSLQKATFSGTITAQNYNVGGVVGQTNPNCSITTSKALNATFNLSNYSSSNTSSIGGIVAVNYGNIQACQNSSNFIKSGGSAIMDRQIKVGGIAGTNIGASAVIYNNQNYGSIDADVRANSAGGITGVNNSTYGDNSTTFSIYACANYATINGVISVGGITGINQNGGIYASVNYTGSIIGRYIASNKSGGIAGDNQSIILCCFNTGSIGPLDIDSQLYTAGASGGISGLNSGSITYCYSLGYILGQTTTAINVSGITAGGLVGINANGATLAYAYSIGLPGGEEGNFIGGVIGQINGDTTNVHNIYFDNEITNIDGVTMLAIGNGTEVATVKGVSSWNLVSQSSGINTSANEDPVDLNYTYGAWDFLAPDIANRVYSLPYINIIASQAVKYSSSAVFHSTTNFAYPTLTIYKFYIQSIDAGHEHTAVTQWILKNYKATKPSWETDVLEQYKYSVQWQIGLTSGNYWNFDTNYVDMGDKNIYAKWTAKSYTIIYHITTPSGTSVVPQSDSVWHNLYTDFAVASVHTYDASTALPTMTKYAGHQFSGWYYDSDLTIEVINGTVRGTISATKFFTESTFNVYGEWTEETYTITLNAVTVDSSNSGYFNDGQPSDNRTRTLEVQVTYNHTYDFDNDVGEVTEVISENSTLIFAGWYTSTGTRITDRFGSSTFNGIDNVWSIDVNSSGTGTLTLYAKYLDAIQKVYFVSYNNGHPINLVDNSGLGYVEVPYEDKVAPLLVGALIPANIPTGMTLLNWYSDNACTTLFDFNNTDIVSATTIYAGWRAWNYTLNFDKNSPDAISGTITQSIGDFDGGSEGVAYNTSIYNVAINTSNTIPRRTGYDFAGWFLETNGTTAVTLTTTMTAGGMTIYAKWNIKHFYIALNYNDDSSTRVVLSTAYVYGQNVQSIINQITTSQIPTNETYGFVAWSLVGGNNYIAGNMLPTDYISSTYTLLDLEELSGTDTLDLYAVWRMQYTITFMQRGGSSVSPIKVWKDSSVNTTYNDSKYLETYCTPTLSGWIFGGWYIVQDGIATSTVLTDNSVISQNITVQAEWTVDRDAGYVAPDNTTPLIIAGVILGIITIVLAILIFSHKKSKEVSIRNDDDDNYIPPKSPFDIN